MNKLVKSNTTKKLSHWQSKTYEVIPCQNVILVKQQNYLDSDSTDSAKFS